MKLEEDDLLALADAPMAEGIGHRFFVRAESRSTNADAREWLATDPIAPHGAVFVTAHQTAGRGTRGRSWWAPADAALPMSVVLAPKVPYPHPAALTLVTSLAVFDAASQLGATARLRWPNDLVDLRGRKFCGVLAEVIQPNPQRIVVGIGVNCRKSVETPPTDLTKPHTDLVSAGAREIGRVAIARAICTALDARLAQFVRDGLAPVTQQFNDFSALRDTRVELGFGSRSIECVFGTLDAELRVHATRLDGTAFSLPAEQLELRRHD